MSEPVRGGEISNIGEPIEDIPVHISFDIIRLFSEGLYQSAHKAVEELVSNGYDAGSRRVHVLLPSSSQPDETEPLWVIDDGSGMDGQGFHRLWTVAESEKASVQVKKGERAPIGQFGIGKLAAYVLAWNLTHISKVDGRILITLKRPGFGVGSFIWMPRLSWRLPDCSGRVLEAA